jgi:hypothetical protein
MLTIKQINAKIASVSKRTATIRADVQTILINAAAHAYQHRDVTAFTRLFAATSGMNRKLIAKWVQDYGFAILQKDGSFKLNASAHKDADFANGEDVVVYLTENARDWFADEDGAGDIVKQLDVAARIKSLASQIKNASNKNTQVTIDAGEIRKAMELLKAAIIDEHTAPATVDAAGRIAA